jgi:hypothetical protein
MCCFLMFVTSLFGCFFGMLIWSCFNICFDVDLCVGVCVDVCVCVMFVNSCDEVTLSVVGWLFPV